MSFPLQSARLCLDCDTVFMEASCPSCNSESYYPLSKWVRPAMANEGVTVKKAAKKASLILVGSGVAYGLWRAFKSADNAPQAPVDYPVDYSKTRG